MHHRRSTAVLVLAATAAAGSCSRADTREVVDAARSSVRQGVAGAADRIADTWLTVKIRTQYLADEDIEARHVEVRTRDRVVTLTGYVKGTEEREQAVSIARTTDGVRRVEDRLATPGSAVIEPVGTSGASAPSDPASDDEALVERIRRRYATDAMLAGRAIEIYSRDGVVTLTGTVESDAERDQA